MATAMSTSIPVHSADWCWKSSIAISFCHSLSQSSLGCEWCRSGSCGLYRIWSRRISSSGRRCSRVRGPLLHILPGWAACLQPYLGMSAKYYLKRLLSSLLLLFLPPVKWLKVCVGAGWSKSLQTQKASQCGTNAAFLSTESSQALSKVLACRRFLVWKLLKNKYRSFHNTLSSIRNLTCHMSPCKLYLSNFPHHWKVSVLEMLA